MAGGDAADLERARPLLSRMGATLIPTGAVGSAHAMKALNNYVYAAGLLAASEALLIARRMGLDLDVFTDVLNASSGRNVATETKLRQFIVPGSYAGGFALALMARTCVPPMRCRRTPACASGSCRCAPGCGSARWRRWSWRGQHADPPIPGAAERVRSGGASGVATLSVVATRTHQQETAMKPIIAARRLAAGLGAALLALAVMHPARAAYPDRPIRMVVPFPPGSITDVVARSLGKAMADDLGQPVVVENKPGANGIIGTHDVARSKPDGYTVVVVGVSTAASGVSLFKNLPYDPAVDLSPIGAVAETPYLLVGSPRLPGASVAELYAYGARHPGKLTYAYGSGSAQVFGAKWAGWHRRHGRALSRRPAGADRRDRRHRGPDLHRSGQRPAAGARRQGQDLWRQHAGTVPAGARHSHAERAARPAST